jgi:hypothetical protein
LPLQRHALIACDLAALMAFWHYPLARMLPSYRPALGTDRYKIRRPDE